MTKGRKDWVRNVAVRIFFLIFLFLSFHWMLMASPAYAACTTPDGGAGAIVYNGSEKFFQYCNGTEWIRMNQRPGAGAGGCVDPVLDEGKIAYNADHRVLQGCAGGEHIAMGPVGGGVQTNWVHIVASKTANMQASFMCGIKNNGSLWCWGSNSFGQLGDNTTTQRLTPFPVSGGGAWVKISAGDDHACGIKVDGTLWCWGRNFNGQLGDSTTTMRSVPAEVSGGGQWKDVSAGATFTCGIKTDDTLWCWGGDFYGQIGNGATVGNQLVPVDIGGGSAWRQVSAGGGSLTAHACAIKLDNTLHCWGDGVSGALGTGNTSSQNAPVQVSGGGSWKTVSTGKYFTCAIKFDDHLYCWGYDSYGNLGNGAGGQTSSPSLSDAGSWKRVSAGVDHACGIKADDTLFCWGRGDNGRLGDGSQTIQQSPVLVVSGGTWTSVAAGTDHSCGIRDDGLLFCWGRNGSGELANDGVGFAKTAPFSVANNWIWSQVGLGVSSSTCAIKDDGGLYCWGSNSSNQLGDNTTIMRLVPTPVSGGGVWIKTSVGGGSACGIKADESLWCWGSNLFGRLGDNSTTQRPVPTSVSGGGAWKDISLGGNHTCGIRSDDRLYCWGWNANGRTGLNTTVGNTLVPTEIDGGGAWKEVRSGGDFTCGIKSDDTLWCWGSNANGRTGLNTAAGNSLVPVEVAGGGAWRRVVAGTAHACGIKWNNTLWCWGNNGSGRLGDGSTTQSAVPVEVNGSGMWIDVGVGGSHSCAIKSGGELLCWGSNNDGQIGDDTKVQRLVPTDVSGGGSWKNVILSTNYTCGLSTSGHLLCWGANADGQLGNGEAINLSLLPNLAWCGAPAGSSGDLRYNADANALQYCDGAGWVKVGIK